MGHLEKIKKGWNKPRIITDLQTAIIYSDIHWLIEKLEEAVKVIDYYGCEYSENGEWAREILESLK